MIRFISILKIVFLFFFISSIGCKEKMKKKMTHEDVEFRLKTMANYGWKSKRSNQYIEGINFSAVEVPNAYYILNNEGEDDLNKIDSIVNATSNERIIEMEFSHVDQKDILNKEFTNRDYDDSIKYLAFVLNKDIKAVTSRGDTINCLGVHFERNFNIAPFKRVILYFSGIDENEKIQLIYNDRLFGKGIIKFNFNGILKSFE